MKRLSEQHEEFPVGTWVRHRKPYFGEGARRVSEHTTDGFVLEHGPGLHYTSGVRELVWVAPWESFGEIYGRIGVAHRVWLWFFWSMCFAVGKFAERALRG